METTLNDGMATDEAGGPSLEEEDEEEQKEEKEDEGPLLGCWRSRGEQFRPRRRKQLRGLFSSFEMAVELMFGKFLPHLSSPATS